MSAQRDITLSTDVMGAIDILQDLVKEQDKGLVRFQEVAQLGLAGRNASLVVGPKGFVAGRAADLPQPSGPAASGPALLPARAASDPVADLPRTQSGRVRPLSASRPVGTLPSSSS